MLDILIAVLLISALISTLILGWVANKKYDELSARLAIVEQTQISLNSRDEEYDRALQYFRDDLDKIKDENCISKNEEESDTGEVSSVIDIPEGGWIIGQELSVPSISSEVKFFTDYRKYNIYGTPHNRLQQVSYTDENGCRRYGDDYLVALGSYYSTDIGDRFEVTLDTGHVFTVMLADGKNDKDLDEFRMYDPCETYGGFKRANVLEFIIDSAVLSKEVYQYGSLDKIPDLQGSITKIIYLGRDESGDWTTYA